MLINIGNKSVGLNKPVMIIAEAGVNHNGSLKLAKKMVDVAKKAGCNAVKFQTFKTDNLVTKNAPQARYQKANARFNSQYEMLKNVELSESDFVELYKYCAKKGILFLSTPFDIDSARFLNKLGMKAFKISSGEVTNIPFLIEIAKFKKPIILSTGMSDLREVKEAVKAIYSTGNKKLILLHCTSNYPTRFEDVNLNAMDTLKKIFNVPIGYSDHTLGVEVALAAVAKGACIIEKHFTLDKFLPGPDHKASADINELMNLVKIIRNLEKAFGTYIKRPVESEIEVSKVARKSIVAKNNIGIGDKLSFHNIVIKRPGTGIAPKYLNSLVGKIVRKSIKEDEVITWNKINGNKE